MSAPSHYEDTEFEDDFDDEFDGVED